MDDRDTGILSGVRVAIAVAVATVVVGLGLTWLVREAVRREVFEESRAYNEGVAQELYAGKRQYLNATLTAAQRRALGAVLLHQVAGYDTGRLPPDLQAFVRQLRRDQVFAPVPAPRSRSTTDGADRLPAGETDRLPSGGPVEVQP